MPQPSRLFGRSSELEVLGQLLAGVRSGQSGVLVVRGEPGIGKTALLRYLMGEASGFRVVRGIGVESEMGLAPGDQHLSAGPLSGPGPRREPWQ